MSHQALVNDKASPAAGARSSAAPAARAKAAAPANGRDGDAWLRGWLSPGEEPVGDVVEIVNRSSEAELIPFPLPSSADKILVFDQQRNPLGFFPVVRDERGRALMVAKPRQPLRVLGVRGSERQEGARPFMVRENEDRVSARIGRLTADGTITADIAFTPLGGSEVPLATTHVVTGAGGFLSFPTERRGPGTYRVVLRDETGALLTSKNIYSHGTRRRELTGVDAAAKRFAPLISLAPGEEQLPVTLGGMIEGLSPEEKVTFRRWNKKKLKASARELMRDVLPYEPEGVIGLDDDNTGMRWSLPNRKQAGVSYAVIPDPNDPTVAHVSYELFYRFDAKSGTRVSPGLAAHAFDAEGIIVTMRREGSAWRPTEVIYRHHVQKQTMGMYGPRKSDSPADPDRSQGIVQTWEHGALRIPYESVIQSRDGRPVVFVAYGSHASYPYFGAKGMGGYRVLWHGGLYVRGVTPYEPAGGQEALSPVGPDAYQLQKREVEETTEGIGASLSGKEGSLPVGTFSLIKTPEEILRYVREASRFDTSQTPPEVIAESRRIAGGARASYPGDRRQNALRSAPGWAALPAAARADLGVRGFDEAWFSTRPPEVRISVLNVYVKLKALGLFSFVERDNGSDRASLTFRCTDVQELKRALRARSDFTNPGDGLAWESREYKTAAALHLKQFGEMDKIQAHIDGRGALPSKPLLAGLAAGTLGVGLALQALAHGVTYHAYANAYGIREQLLGQGFDRAVLLGVDAP